MLVKRPGVASAIKRLADGLIRKHYHAWRGGPKLEGEPGSAEFVKSYHDAHKQRRAPAQEFLFTLISEFRAGAEYGALSTGSRRAYNT